MAEIRARRESLSSFAARIGVKSQDINNWKRRGIPRSKQKRVADALGWSLDRLLRDDYGCIEDQLQAHQSHPTFDHPSGGAIQDPASYSARQRRMFIEALSRLDIWMPQRRIAWVDDQVKVLPDATAPFGFARSWMESAGLREDSVVLCTVGDDSMDPYFGAGDLLLVDLDDRCPVDAGVFVAWTLGTIAVRRLYIAYEGSWILRSGNPSVYPDQIVPPADQGTRLRLVGRVRWHAGSLV